MSVLQFSPCTEIILKVDPELLENPLGFVLDAGGSLTKLVYRSKQDYNKGKPLKPSKHGILRMKSFLIEELEGLPTYIKENVDVCISEEHRNMVWGITGATTKSFIKSLQEELNIKLLLDWEMSGLTRSLKAHKQLKIPFHHVNVEPLARAAKISASFLGMLSTWSKMGDDSLTDEFGDKMALPPDHYFSDLLSTKDIKSWANKHLPVPTSLEPPFMLLMTGSAGIIGSIDKDFKFKMIDVTAACGKTLSALAEELIGEKDFNKFIQLAQEGDSTKVDLRTNDFRKDDGEQDWYSVFPDDHVAFELGKLSSNNIEGRNKDFSKADLAAGLLSLQLHTLCKMLILCIRVSKVYDVYVCGSIFQFPHVRKVFETHFYSDSLLTSLEHGQLFRLYFFDNPGYLVGLGMWVKNLEKDKLRKTSQSISTI